MESTRAAAFEALGSLSTFAAGAQFDTFMEQVNTNASMLRVAFPITLIDKLTFSIFFMISSRF